MAQRASLALPLARLTMLDREGPMPTKTSSLTYRIAPEERAALEAYIARDGRGLSLSQAIRELVAAGLRTVLPRERVDLTALLRELDPAWSGRPPRFGRPLKLRTADGTNPMDALLQAEREP